MSQLQLDYILEYFMLQDLFIQSNAFPNILLHLMQRREVIFFGCIDFSSFHKMKSEALMENVKGEMFFISQITVASLEALL